MIIMDEKLVGIWFLQTDKTTDWMCGLREVEPNIKYELTYRFRYYKDDNAFDSEDEKHWSEYYLATTRDQAILGIRKVVGIMTVVSAKEPYELLNKGNIDEFISEFLKAPFVHYKTADSSEC